MKSTRRWALVLGMGFSLTAPASVTARCLGDYDQSGAVSVSELILSVSAALKGCSELPRFVDNGDGTITDNDTRLLWEKKVEADAAANPDNLHDADNTYWWSGACVPSLAVCQSNPVAAAACAAGVDGVPQGCSECADGAESCVFGASGIATIWDWLTEINAGLGFAGHTDWRVPTRQELLSLAPEDLLTCSESATCAGLVLAADWSATTLVPAPGWAWVVASDAVLSAEGKVGSFANVGAHAVMAVRGGPLGGGPCPGDHDSGGGVSVDELVLSVSNAVRGCPTRFVDNADGTISDTETGLMWEKKVALDNLGNEGDPHDADNAYRWAGFCVEPGLGKQCQPDQTAARACTLGVDGDPDGCSTCADGEGACLTASEVPALWSWLTVLNAASFAGHQDWRLPTIQELRTIADYDSSFAPTIDAAFHGSHCGRNCLELSDPACSCTDGFVYWSASSVAEYAQVVSFVDGSVRSDSKTSFGFPAHARAVRNGS